MRILKEHTMAVIIDIQERLFPHMYEYEALEKNINILIRGLKIIQVPLIVTEQYPKGLGLTIPSVAASLNDYNALEKTTFSCCDDKGFLNILSEFKPVHIIIAGIETHVCIQQTAVDLLSSGYIPVVVADCVSSRKLSDKQIALKRIKSEGGIIATYESVLFELLRDTGTVTFKEISKLVK